MTNTPKIYAALAKAQADMTKAIKDSTNPHFGKTYADLGAVQEACLPALHKHGFAVYQPFITDEAGYWVETVLAHESGETVSCRIPLLLGKHDMQGLGSAITYARRYGLFCMSGVAPEDDDGNKAADQGHKEPVRRKAPATDNKSDARHEEDVAREIAEIAKIADLEHLRSAWAILNKAIPAVAADARVIAAKEKRKAELIEQEPAE